MNLDRLRTDLSRPEAFPEAPDSVEREETHISLVFLGERTVYKVKKPLTLPFLDYGSLDRRAHFCRREVTLNRRLAPEVYLDTVPVTEGEDGLRFEGSGTPVEWAVKMRRLPPTAMLSDRLEQGALRSEDLGRAARRIARFHDHTARGAKIARYGRFRVVAANMLENLRDGREQIGTTLTRTVFDRLAERTRAVLTEYRSLIEERARAEVPCDAHGDLRLEHVYLVEPGSRFADEGPLGDVVIVDCVEFNDRYRYADPVSDAAFLEMDLRVSGRRDLAASFARAYFEARPDEAGRALLPLYASYRSAVRAKVQGIKALQDAESGSNRTDERDKSGSFDSAVGSEDERGTRRSSAKRKGKGKDETNRSAADRARAHWLLALERLEPPARKPCLLLVGGLPGTGKSTLARGLGEEADFALIDTDRVRKELAGLPLETTPSPEQRARLYTEEAKSRTYAETRSRARKKLREGGRVLVDASFHRPDRRLDFFELGRDHAVPTLLLICRTPEATIRSRLNARTGDPSDATWRVYEKMKAAWEPVDPPPGTPVIYVDTDESPETVTLRTVKKIRACGLA